MTKQELLNSLRQALDTEESAMPLYTGHITSMLLASNFDADEQNVIRETLHTLKVESLRHNMVLNQLIEKVQSEDKDVY